MTVVLFYTSMLLPLINASIVVMYCCSLNVKLVLINGHFSIWSVLMIQYVLYVSLKPYFTAIYRKRTV